MKTLENSLDGLLNMTGPAASHRSHFSLFRTKHRDSVPAAGRTRRR